MMKFLNIEPSEYSKKAIEIYSSLGDYQELIAGDSPESFGDKSNVNCLIIRLAHRIDKSFLQPFSHLQYILTPTTGLDHVDLEYCRERQIEVICLRGHHSFLKEITSTPELTWALLLAAVRNLTSAHNSVLELQWDRDRFRGYQLKGKTIGIIGLGRTGSQVAEYAKAFGMNVIFYDPYVDHESLEKFKTLEALLAASDVVSIHVHLNEETQLLLNKENLKAIKTGSILVNTSRGKIVDEIALVELLEKGVLRAVASDVLSEEFGDISVNPLYRAAKQGLNIILTPHLGGATFDAMHICEEFIANQLKAKLSN